MTPQKNRIITITIVAALLAITIALTCLAYQRGLLGYFIFDDIPNIVDNSALAIKNLHPASLLHAALSSTSGPLRRPVSMLSFALNIYATGFTPYYFKLTNLLIHLLSGAGTFFLSAALLDAYRRQYDQNLQKSQALFISLAITSAWLLHPLNLTGVLYIVQRMTSLSALFSFWGLYCYAAGRNRMIDGKGGSIAVLASLLIFTPLAILSKESGALMPLLMLLIELVFYRFRSSNPVSRRFLQLLFGVSVGLPALALLGLIATHPAWLPNSYTGRSFTLTERLLTEPRILWFYLSQILSPNLKQLGLFHDDIAISRDLLTPISTLPAILGICALLVGAWIARNKLPILTFGILFFFAGHALESTIFPLEITFEHRNYLPMYGILFAALFYLIYPLRYLDTLRLRQAVTLIFIAVLAFDTWTRSNAWATPFDQAKDEVEHHPNSARDNGNIARNYANITTADPALNDIYYARAQHYFQQATAVDPNYTTGLFSMILLSAEKGKASDPTWAIELKHRLQAAYLDNDIGNTLSLLVTCQTQNVCKFSRGELYDLLQAPLSNPSVTGGKRALVYSALSTYYVNIAGDYPAATGAMRQSIALSPNEPLFRWTLVKFLTALRHFDEAKRELADLKKADTLHAYDAQIAAEEKKIAGQENAPLQ